MSRAIRPGILISLLISWPLLVNYLSRIFSRVLSAMLVDRMTTQTLRFVNSLIES